MLRGMIKFPLLLAASFCWFGLLRLEAQTPTAPPPSTPPPTLAASQGVGEQAKRDGWQSACVGVDLIHPQEGFPGLTAWMEDFKQADAAVTKAGAHGVFPDLKINDLLVNNPRFWQAFYEVLPGDPGMALIQSGLLLAGGEAQRASTIATLALQRPGIPAAFRKALQEVAARAYAAQQPAIALSEEGVALHDQDKFTEALAKYDAALKLWPNTGWTHYERGFTLRMMALKALLEKAGPGKEAEVPKPEDPPEVVRAFAKARQHDPFQLAAYQGSDPAVIKGLSALAKKVKPAWMKVEENSAAALTDAELQTFAEGCQDAGIHDYALVAHGVVVARRGKYLPADLVWISESLAAAAPGVATEKALQALEGKELQLMTLVPIEASGGAATQKSE